MHWPAELTEPCSWYCQRETTGGCQQEPADVLQATGAGRVAAAGAAARGMSCGPGQAQAGVAATADRTSTAPASEPNARAPCIATSSDDVPRREPPGGRRSAAEGGRGSHSPPDLCGS